MNLRAALTTVLAGSAVALGVGVIPATANAATPSPAVAAQAAAQRQAIGVFNADDGPSGKTFAITVASSGSYVVEYFIQYSAAVNTTVDKTALPQITGGYQQTVDTRAFTLAAGKHTVHVGVPDGYGDITAYLVKR